MRANAHDERNATVRSRRQALSEAVIEASAPRLRGVRRFGLRFRQSGSWGVGMTLLLTGCAADRSSFLAWRGGDRQTQVADAAVPTERSKQTEISGQAETSGQALASLAAEPFALPRVRAALFDANAEPIDFPTIGLAGSAEPPAETLAGLLISAAPAFQADEPEPALELRSPLAVPIAPQEWERITPVVLPPEDQPPLTLNEVIATCLQQDPVLAAGFQEIAEANGEWVTASLRPNPEFEIVQSLLPLVRPFEADFREGGPPQLDLMMSYPIDWYLFGKRVAAMRSAAAEVRVSRSEYLDLVRQRVLESSLAYYDVVEAVALLQLAQQDVSNLRDIELATEVGVENGAVPLVELNRIRLDRLNSEQTLREARRDMRTARAGLLAVIGGSLPSRLAAPNLDSDDSRFDLLEFPVEDLLVSKESLPSPNEDLDDLAGLIRLARANRPDLQALEGRVGQRALEAESQRREAYPEVKPLVGYTRQFQRRAIGQPDADSWGAGLEMTLPINDRNQGNRLAANARWRQSQQEMRLGLIELRAEIIEVVQELRTAQENAEAIAEEQLRLSEEVRDAIWQAYEAGGRPLIDALDAQRNYRETFSNFITSRADYLRAVQRFRATIGVTPGAAREPVGNQPAATEPLDELPQPPAPADEP